MCAIAGLIGLPPKDAVSKMLETMKRRGPDGQGVFTDRDNILLHTRLAVIDPVGGKQPMELSFGQERYAITYNGELYNTDELRRELERSGHRFVTDSDTEVVLHAYVRWGSDCLDKLNGIFAFGIWEQNRSRLFLARDRMGVKPLFYKLHDGGLIFASEMKTILIYPDVGPELDITGAAQILLLGPGRIPGSGVFCGIEELEPGQCAFFEKGKLQKWTYWKLQDRQHFENFEQTADHVRYLVTDAIKRQLVSDVPLGTFLSGGLDSSLISAVCANAYRDRGEKLTTFSVDYRDNEKYFEPGKFQPNSDGHYIGVMCDFLQTDHHWTVLTPEDLVAQLENATIARDLPGMADVDFSLLAFCGRIREKVTVALSGECADEIFGGYPWYRDPEIRAEEGFPWAQNTSYRASFLHPQLGNQIDAVDFVKTQYLDTVQNTDILPGASEEEIKMKQMIHLNQRWFMQTLLDRKDRMSMFHGLEVRVPFCDHRIAQYLYSVPWEYKNYLGREKGLLRYAMRGLLPEEILYRKKSPYPKTFDPRYTEAVSNMLKEILASPQEPIHQLIRREALEGLLSANDTWPWYGQLMKVPQTMAYMLQINFWLRNYKIFVK